MTELQRKAPGVGLSRLCGLFGKTRQAWYDHRRRAARERAEGWMAVQMVLQIRRKHPRMGARKLYELVKPDLEIMGIKLGRDVFFALLRAEGLLVSRRRKGTYTTNSRHWFTCYDNLIEDLVIDRPEQVWAGDITYIRLQNDFCYLSLLTDAYSRKIVGYHLHRTLEACGSLMALDQALEGRRYRTESWSEGDLIHHSDRGIQYCCHEYVDRLRRAEVAVSMTYQGNGENAIAERVNGILKEEYLLGETFGSYEAALQQVHQAIWLYNEERPHLSLDMLTPAAAHEGSGIIKRRWRDRKRTETRSACADRKDIHQYTSDHKTGENPQLQL